MAEENKKLQKSRKDEIPKIINKYQSLIDGILKEVAKAFPTFKDISIKDGDDEDTIIRHITAEEQLYNFMVMRERAIDHADKMSIKINELELELNAPELLEIIKQQKATEGLPAKAEAPKRNISKERARKTT